MKTTKGIVHAIFHCTNCDRKWENYLTAQKEAYEHAKKYKHIVKGETGYAITYNGRILDF